MSTEVLHRIDRPFANGVIEVYGEPDMGWYEWRILERGAVIHDTRDAGYGSPGIALRDALNHDEPLHQGSAQERALDALANLASVLQGSPDGDHVAGMIREAMDTIDGYGKWPTPEDLSEEFKANVATWQYKGNLWGGLHIVRDVSGAIHPMVADYVHLETMHSGGLYDSWAAAFAAFGAALDAWGK
ncbi:hypothetical protein [Modicisalibacter tunisiensis]|uniref:Uncharacterized protein n=1 Tax=Modicisalibacter tunisiensis TaxID=390637 RepID=A0ABS7X304_9GAMM|nr:hypothetical protein [Modicisalibacter tunisiensis]MBZ9540516.1 hypothetical protein [Modicisalibacter tunisiensis]MBZ9569270.1 hypothetical protein [Modicisalibacter tunisiensis]